MSERARPEVPPREAPEDWPDLSDGEVLCRREWRAVAAAEHVACPYCFGRLRDVLTGRHERFCDYREGRDPIHFGFPEGEVRSEHG